jgi:hypothetical protein
MSNCSGCSLDTEMCVRLGHLRELGLGGVSTQQCANCGYLPASRLDPSANFLKKCSRCNEAFYCNKECQTKHWKSHKGMCKLVNERRAETSARLGSGQGALFDTFYNYTMKWHDKHVVPLCEMAKCVITEELVATTALVVYCTYSTVDRPDHQLMHIDRYLPWALADLYQTHPTIEQACEECPVTHRSPDFVYFRVVIISTNLDMGKPMQPHNIVSNLVYPKGKKRSRTPLEPILRDIHSGCFMLL